MSAPNPVFRLAKLRSKTLKQASKFHDYNFRMFFLQKTIDTYNTVAKQPEEQIRAFCEGTGKEQYLQMKRMATLNATYAKTPVFLDPVLSVDLAAEAKAEKSLPQRRAFSSDDGEEGEGGHANHGHH